MVCTLFLFSILVFFPSIPLVRANGTFSGIGPYLDKLNFTVIQDDTQQVLALIDGDVDIIGDAIDPAFLDQLYSASDVEVSEHQRLGYGITYINCEKYPMNITNFRRAIAFALDKNRVIEEGFLGLAKAQDCNVPSQHPASIEDEMIYHMYEENIALGETLLNDAGFIDTDEDGWREGPGPGGPGTVELDPIIVEGHPTTQIDIFVDTVVQAMLNLNISAEARQTSIFDFDPRLNYHGDYDMIFKGSSWPNLALDYFAKQYSTEYIDTPYYNIPNWSNATWDSYADTVLHSSDYDEIITAAKEMQNIWVHSCPALIMYQNSYFTAYRNDTFDGIVSDIISGVTNYFTNLNVHLKSGGPFGGTYTWAQPSDILSFNPCVVNSASVYQILESLYDPLLRVDPDGNLMNWLAESYTIETHADNSAVPDGHTRIKFNIVDNATWSDGLPITAQDAAFTINYMRDSNIGNIDYTDLYAAYAPTDSEFILEFSEESYWYLYHFGPLRILPKHVWQNFDNYIEFDPAPATIDEMVVSGPFLPKKWLQGKYVELEYNPYYFKLPERDGDGGGGGGALGGEGGAPPPVEEDDVISNIVERLGDDELLMERIDPLLSKYIEYGEIDDKLALSPEGEVQVILYIEPELKISALRAYADVKWTFDAKLLKVVHAQVHSSKDLGLLTELPGVRYVGADCLLDEVTYSADLNPEIEGIDMYKIRDVIGATEAWATYGYNGSGIIVGFRDSAIDFSQPDMKDAIAVNGTGHPMSYDPSGWAIELMTIANNSYVENITEWLDAGYLLTYESGSKYYLNVSGWDPAVSDTQYNNVENMLGFYFDYYSEILGWANFSEFVYDELWNDWEIPAPSPTHNYTTGWLYQRRNADADVGRVRLFAPALIMNNSKLVFDFNGSKAFSYLHTGYMYEAPQFYDINNQADRDFFTDLMDWSFIDDWNDGYVFEVDGKNVIAADTDNDGIDDWGFGSFCWAYDSVDYHDRWFNNIIPGTPEEELFCGMRKDGLGYALLFPIDIQHGHWTGATVGSRGEIDHDVHENNNPVKLPGIAKGATLISCQAYSGGSSLESEFWAAGFHLAPDGNWTYTGQHKAHIHSNSWGYSWGTYVEQTYLGIIWDMMAVPGFIHVSNPGTLFLFSVGNEGPGYMTTGPPATSPAVISVGGTWITHRYDEDGFYGPQLSYNHEAPGASKGPSYVGLVKPDILAPYGYGVSPHSLDKANFYDTSYYWWAGSSLACTIAAGGTAIILEAMLDNGWSYNPLVLGEILQSTADDIGYDPFYQGNGFINVTAAVKAIVSPGDELYFNNIDSYNNWAMIMNETWNSMWGFYYGSEWGDGHAPIANVWVDENSPPMDYGMNNLFFGNVLQSGTAKINFTATDFTGAGVEYASLTSATPWYYTKKNVLTFDVETYKYNDTHWYNYTEWVRDGTFNITEYMDGAFLTDFWNAPMVTIAVHNTNEIDGIRIFDWNDTVADEAMNYYNASQSNDYVKLLTRCNNPFNTQYCKLAHPDGMDDLFDYWPLLQIYDDNADFSTGTWVHVTIVLWEKTTDSKMGLSAGIGTNITATLTLAADTEPGIHAGFIEIVNGTFTHQLPYSYMCGYELGGDIGTEEVVIDGWGDEHEAYDSGVIHPCVYDTNYPDYGQRNILLKIPDDYPTKTRTVLAAKIEWENPGTIVDLFFKPTGDSFYSQYAGTDDSEFYPNEDTQNTIIFDFGGLMNGTYYLHYECKSFNGTDFWENVTITLQWWDISLPSPSCDFTWWSRWNPTPAAFGSDDILAGDHVEVKAEWSDLSVTGLPEYQITRTKIEFASGIHVFRGGDIPTPYGDVWPPPYSANDTYIWETVEGITKNSIVHVTLSLHPGGDASFLVHEWFDLDEDGKVDWEDELGELYLSKDDAGDAYEYGEFTAPHDMNIAIMVYCWEWAYSEGIFYDLEVNSRRIDTILETDDFCTFDTYNFLFNISKDITVYGYSDTNINFETTVTNISLLNFFTPSVSNVQVTGAGPEKTVSWNTDDLNSDDENFFDVFVSIDDGITYQLIAQQLSISPYIWNSTGFTIRDSYRVKVVAYDNDTAYTGTQNQLNPWYEVEGVGWDQYENLIGFDFDNWVQNIWPALIGYDESTSLTAGTEQLVTRKPFVDGSEQEYFIQGDEYNVTWHLASLYPQTIEVWLEDVKIHDNGWNTVTNTTNVAADTSIIGSYNYTIRAIDITGNAKSFTTIVEIVGQVAPTVDNPMDIVYNLSTTGNTLTWSPWDADPLWYEVYRNGTEIHSSPWDGSEIVVDIDGLALGTHNYTLNVTDGYLNSAFDTVIVRVVIDSTTPTIDSPDDVAYNQGQIGNTITWDPDDDYPASYQILKNGTPVKSGKWNTTDEDIIFNVDGLLQGTYNFTIIVTDVGGHSVSDTVIVSVARGHTSHVPIHITSDAYFASNATAEGWIGDGTEGSPYIIEWLQFDFNGTCIIIQGVTVYFIIRDCIFYSTGRATSGYYDDAISILNSDNGLIFNCTFYDQDDTAVFVWICPVTIANCTFINNREGIHLTSCPPCTIANNTFVNCGLGLEASAPTHYNHTVENNLVNNKPIGYYYQLTDEIIAGNMFAQIILGECTNVTIQYGYYANSSQGIQIGFSTGCIIRNNTVIYNTMQGIRMTACIQCVIGNNTIRSNGYGISVYNSEYCTISDNTIRDSRNEGLMIWNSNNTIMRNNEIFGNSWGMFHHISYNCIVDSNVVYDNRNHGMELAGMKNCTVSNNELYDNLFGLDINTDSNFTVIGNFIYENRWSGILVWNSYDCKIINNTIYDNLNHGIRLLDSHDIVIQDILCYGNSWSGVRFIDTENCILDPSIIFGNSEHGVYLDNASLVTMSQNEIYNNVGYGVYIDGDSSSNSVGDNLIGWNGLGNAWDDGTGNTWSENLWGDWKGVGSYSIPGAASSVDDSPIKADTTPPIITPPNYIYYELGETGQTIIWAASDDHPESYIIYRQGAEVESGNWAGGDISIIADESSVGSYNYTLVVEDTCGNTEMYTVWVYVEDTTLPAISSISLDPSTPDPDQSVTVTATITDLGGLAEVTLSYSINGGTTWTNVSMTQGTGDLWSGIVPGQATDTTVNYRIHAKDNSDNSYTTITYDYTVSGTPDDTLGPSISGLSANPSSPTSSQWIEFTVSVTDTSGVAEVKLSYSIDNQATWTNLSMSHTSGDEWTASIEPQPADTTVHYKTYARDNNNNWAESGVQHFTVIAAPSGLDPTLLIIIGAGGAGIVAIIAIVMLKKKPKKPKPEKPVPFAAEEELEALRYAEPTPVAAKVVAAPKPEVVEKTVKALRGGEIVGGRFEYKIKIKNDTDFVINNVTAMIVAYPEDCMKIDGSTSKKISRIEPGGFRSPQFIFSPTKDCVEGRVQATVSYVDHQDNTQIIRVEPYTIRSVCDLLKPLEATMEEFDLMLYDMAATSERVTLDWNPQVLVTKASVLLPMKNFQVIESKGEVVDGEYRGVIRGLAEGKYTGKKVAVRISVSGDPDGDKSIVLVEGLGDDEAMLPTTVHELAEGIEAWICLNCGAPLNPNEVADIKGGKFVTCRYCTHTLTSDLYRKRS